MFIIRANKGVVSLVTSSKVLTYFSDNKELYMSNRRLSDIDSTPYTDIEQALDDLEYEISSKIPKRVITSFKNKINNRVIESSAIKEDFKVESEENFISIIHPESDTQLNCFPASETNSGNSEFSITTTSFEPVKDYEVLASDFTDDIDEALVTFQDVVGSLPLDIEKEFKKQLKILENSEVESDKSLIEELGEGYLYVPSDEEAPFQVYYEPKIDTLTIDFVDEFNEEDSLGYDFEIVSFDEIKETIKKIYSKVDIKELEKALEEFNEV